MDITPLISSDRQVIQSYGQGQFRVSNQTYHGPIVVFPDKVLSWPVLGKETLSPADFLPLAEQAGKPDVVLFGTGKTMAFYPPSFKRAVKDIGLSVDVMDTGAACRTYNVLMAEGRRVAAALLPVTD